jgi:hypothetical protein
VVVVVVSVVFFEKEIWFFLGLWVGCVWLLEDWGSLDVW